MPNQVTRLATVLGKIQPAFGTAEVGLVNTDVLEVEGGYTAEAAVRVAPVKLITGGWSQNKSVLGPRDANVSMQTPFRTGGAEGSFGQIDNLIRAAGFTYVDSDTDADLTDDRRIYTPTAKYSEWEALTIWNHSGNLDTSGSMIDKLQNIIGSGKIMLDFENSTAVFALEGKGLLTSEPANGTAPTITPSTVRPPALKDATVSLLGESDYYLKSFEIDCGVAVVPTLKPGAADSSGLGVTLFTDWESKWTAKFYCDSAITNPHTTFLAGTTGAISIAWGTAPNKCTVGITTAEISESPKRVDDGGVQMWELSGKAIHNSITIQLDTAEA